uniref:Uncharacterized protein n=1 Tax=Rhizophora mucronata TaxID=61149 RepID=A0A2P2Q9P1_RHIMU
MHDLEHTMHPFLKLAPDIYGVSLVSIARYS